MKKVMSKKLSDETIVQREFMRRFSTWDVPLEPIDGLLGKLSNEERQAHYFELQQTLETKAFHREINDWKRRVARTLAIGSQRGKILTELETMGLRILMLEIENFVETLERRAQLVVPPQQLRSRSDKI